MQINRRRLLTLSSASVLAGCAGPTVDSLRDPVPEPLQADTVVPGYARIRYWGDDPNGISAQTVAEIGAQQRASGNMSPNRSFLSVSGGGSNGAFGAGLLFG